MNETTAVEESKKIKLKDETIFNMESVPKYGVLSDQ